VAPLFLNLIDGRKGVPIEGNLHIVWCPGFLSEYIQCCSAAIKQGINPKFETLNTKQHLNPNVQILNVLVIRSFVLGIYLGFRN